MEQQRKDAKKGISSGGSQTGFGSSGGGGGSGGIGGPRTSMPTSQSPQARFRFS